MVPFYRSYKNYYWSAIALSCTNFELLDVNIVTLKSGLRVIPVH